MNILVPAIPARCRIPYALWEALMTDPVMAAEILLGVRLDVFQAVRLRIYWWFPEVIDSSGFSSGKTIVNWAFAMLRAILLPEQDVGVYMPTLETGKNTFWKYFDTNQSRIFRAHLGRVDEHGDASGSAKTEGGGACKAYFRNGSTVYMPAPSFMKQAATQGGMRFNTLIVDEWTKIESMWGAGDAGGIDIQLKGRTTKPSWNQHHPIWGNHILMTATAETQLHPGYTRYAALERAVRQGNPNCMVISFCYKDYSNLPMRDGKSFAEICRIDSVIDSMRRTKGRASAQGEVFGHWARNGLGWFTEAMLLQAQDLGRRRGVRPMLGAGDRALSPELWREALAE
jgi:hypothetical protein